MNFSCKLDEVLGTSLNEGIGLQELPQYLSDRIITQLDMARGQVKDGDDEGFYAKVMDAMGLAIAEVRRRRMPV
jgi:hypothetical protein